MTDAIPTISVVIPCYNSEKYLAETVDSILANRCDGLAVEIIAVNDCSSDNTLGILKRYESDLRIIDKTANEGACRARNDGIKAARGEFIALCDHDDLWAADKLRLQVEKFRDPEVGLVCSDADTFSEAGVLVASMAAIRPMKRGWVFHDLLKKNFIIQSSVMIRRRVLDETGFFAEQIFPAEDIDLWLRITRNWQVEFVDKVLVHYRISSTMYSRDKFRMKKARIPVIARHAKHLDDRRQEAIVMSSAIREFAMDYWYARRFLEARSKFKEALSYQPFDVRSCFYFAMTHAPVPILKRLLHAKAIVSNSKGDI